jgi:hypothetical protein
MKTSDLITLLATNPEPFDPRVVTKSLAWPLALGIVISIVLSGAVIGFLPAQDFLLPVVWAKFVYGAALVMALVALLGRLYRPGAPTQAVIKWPLLVLLSMTVIGFVSLMLLPESKRAVAIFGQTWLVCPWFVLGLSMPALAAFLGAAKRLAPTDLKTTGFAAGLLAGAIGALGYSFACPEMSLTFVAIWYTVGIVLAGLVGRAVGPMVLRW